MASVEETEIMGNLLTKLEKVLDSISGNQQAKNEIKGIIAKFDEVLC